MIENHILTPGLKEKSYPKTFDDQICAVCMSDVTNVKMTYFLPCRHSSVCENCVKLEDFKACPVCCQTIQKIKHTKEFPDWTFTASGEKLKRNEEEVFKVTSDFYDAGIQKIFFAGQQSVVGRFCIAVDDYTPSDDNAEFELTFRKGDKIEILMKGIQGWWICPLGWSTGKLKGETGVFRNDHVKLVKN